jgi:tripartite-type tricarboxylate transporter receptor subunit TctC
MTFGLIAIKNDFPAKTLKELIAYAKANPGKVTLAHAGIGSSNYLICRTFVKAAGIDVTLVGYRGAGPALNDLIGGQIDGACDTATSLSGAINGKQVNAIVSGSTVRLPSLPGVPTAAEAGLPEFESQGWNAIFVPKGTPDAVIAKLNEAARKALASEAVIKRFGDLSSVVPSADEQTQAFIARLVPDEIEKFRTLLVK